MSIQGEGCSYYGVLKILRLHVKELRFIHANMVDKKGSVFHEGLPSVLISIKVMTTLVLFTINGGREKLW